MNIYNELLIRREEVKMLREHIDKLIKENIELKKKLNEKNKEGEKNGNRNI